MSDTMLDAAAERAKNTKGLRVGICMPCGHMMSSYTAYDWAMMMASVGADMIGGAEVRTLMSTGDHLMQQRQELAQLVVDVNATHLLLLHPRMRFPKDTLHRLLVRRLPVCGINSVTAGPPLPEAMSAEGPIFSLGKTGTEAVEIMPLGIVLIEVHVLRTLPKPWFQHAHVDGEFAHEGTYFSHLLTQHGFTPTIDHDLSLKCAQSGNFDYRHDHTTVLKDMVEPELIVKP